MFDNSAVSFGAPPLIKIEYSLGEIFSMTSALYVLIVSLGGLESFAFHLAPFYHYRLTPVGQITKRGGHSWNRQKTTLMLQLRCKIALPGLLFF